MNTTHKSINLSKWFGLVSLLAFFVSTFMAGNTSVAHAQESFAGDYYYYVNGNRIQLTPSSDWVSVQFASDDSAVRGAALRNYNATFGAMERSIQLKSHGLTLLPLTAGLQKQTLGAMRADTANFSQVNPVFQTADAELAITNEFVVTFPAWMGMDEINAVNAANGVELVDVILGQENTFVLRVGAGADLLGMANQYQESGIAVYSAPNFIRIVKSTLASAPVAQTVSPMGGLNDQFYGSQWHLNNTQQFGAGTTNDADIDAPEAWERTTGDPSVVIAVLDEGVDLSHEDFGSRLVAGYDATGAGSNGGMNGDDAHGTNVSGLAAANGNNNAGVAGVCPQCRIMPVRIADADEYGYWETTDAAIANGIAWAYQNGADILNNSWGGGGESTVVTTAIHNARTLGREGKGSVVVFAAGNNNFIVSYPALLNDVIAVGASNLCDQRKTPTNDLCNGYEYWWGSNYGDSLDISAPGVWLYSTDIMGAAGYDAGNYFAEMNGTSGAAPIVSGVAGLILSVNPNLTAGEVQTVLQNSADDVNGGGFDKDMGYGRVNANRAVQMAKIGTFNISGNAGVGGATLTYTDGVSKTVTTDDAGVYTLSVSSGWSGEVVPSKAGYTFAPASILYSNVSADQADQNYVTTASGSLFADVSSDYWALSFIERLYNSGISRGCGTDPLIYCPQSSVTRAQMAIFILRGMYGSDYVPPVATGTVFGDVPAGSFAADWIEQLAAEGITSGCGGGNYCPDANVTRAQMAVFLLRGKYGSAYVPPTAAGVVFTDAPLGSFAVDWIEQLAAEGVTSGCGGGNYCPDANVTRDQMAVFLVKTFTLP